MADFAPTVADVLDKAADELIVRGRTRTVRMDAEGHVCMIGALGFAMFGESYAATQSHASPWPDSIYDIGGPFLDFAPAVEYLSLLLGSSVWMYNDTIPLTLEGDAQVIETLRSAAMQWREENQR